MSRIFTLNTSNYCTITASPGAIGTLFNGAPGVSLHMRIFPTSICVGTLAMIWMVGDVGGMQFSVGANNGLRFGGRSQSTDSNLGIIGLTTITMGRWWSVGGHNDYANKFARVYIDGKLDGIAKTSSWGSTTYVHSAATIPDEIAVGAAVPPAATTTQFNGAVAEVAMWNVALSDTQFGELAQGTPASLVQRNKLVFYAPITGRASPEVDLISGKNIIINGSLPEGPQVDQFVSPIINYNALVTAAPPATATFRRSASRIGTRTGTRQTWAA